MSKKTTDIVGYLWVIGWLIAFFCGKRSESRFHLNQAFTCHAASLAISLVNAFVSVYIVRVLMFFCSIFVFVSTASGLIYAAMGQERELPFMGGILFLRDDFFEKKH